MLVCVMLFYFVVSSTPILTRELSNKTVITQNYGQALGASNNDGTRVTEDTHDGKSQTRPVNNHTKRARTVNGTKRSNAPTGTRIDNIKVMRAEALYANSSLIERAWRKMIRRQYTNQPPLPPDWTPTIATPSLDQLPPGIDPNKIRPPKSGEEYEDIEGFNATALAKLDFTTMAPDKQAANKFTKQSTTTYRPTKTKPIRLTFTEACDSLMYYCMKAYRTGRLCARSMYYLYKDFPNYCSLDYVNCMERYQYWQIVHMGRCMELDILSQYRIYHYNDDSFLAKYMVESEERTIDGIKWS